jgi:hypothetical protein
VDKELPLNERLANSVTDTTEILIRYVSIAAVDWGGHIPPKVVTPALRAI